jgi:hypothetical protein
VRPNLYNAKARGELERRVFGDTLESLQREIEQTRTELAEAQEELKQYRCLY